MKAQDHLRLALVQTDILFENPSGNQLALDKLLIDFHQADVVLLPELFTAAFNSDPAKVAEPIEGSTMQWMKQWAQELSAAVVGSLPIREQNQYFNRLIWMMPDGSYQFYDKRHLFSKSLEHETYTGGKDRLIVSFRGWKICPQICFDLRFPVWSRNVEHYDLAVYVANWPAVRSFAWQHLLIARAIENQCYVAGVNRIGVGPLNEVYDGNSLAVDPLGNQIIHLGSGPSTHEVDIDKKTLRHVRQKLPFLEAQDRFRLQE